MEQLDPLLKSSGNLRDKVAKRTQEPGDGEMRSKRHVLGKTQPLYPCTDYSHVSQYKTEPINI